MQLNNFQARAVLSMKEHGVKSFKLCFDNAIVNSDFRVRLRCVGRTGESVFQHFAEPMKKLMGE